MAANREFRGRDTVRNGRIKRERNVPGAAYVASERFLSRVNAFVPLSMLLPLELLAAVDAVVLADVKMVVLDVSAKQVCVRQCNLTQLTTPRLRETKLKSLPKSERLSSTLSVWFSHELS